MERIVAAAQYDDFKGTAAADEISPEGKSLSAHAEEQGLYDPASEMLVGFEFWMGENVGGQKPQVPNIRILIAAAPSLDEYQKQTDAGSRPKLRRSDIKLSSDEFFSCFKRFAITQTRDGLDLNGAEVEID